jgi:hypothetical protein
VERIGKETISDIFPTSSFLFSLRASKPKKINISKKKKSINNKIEVLCAHHNNTLTVLFLSVPNLKLRLSLFLNNFCVLVKLNTIVAPEKV